MSHSLIAKSVTWFFNELNARNIRYAVLRKAELIPDAIGNDIDVLVAPEEELKNVIFDCAKEFGFNVYERRNTKGYYPILYRFEGGALVFFRLDFTNLVKNFDELLEKRLQNEKGIYYLPEGEYEKKTKSGLKNIFTYPWRFLSPPGKFVVIVGPDGVGKSTTAELVRQLLEAFHVPVAHMHLGFRPKVLPTRRGIMSFGKEKPVQGEESRVPGWLRFLYHSLDHFLGFWCVIRPALVRGKTVIGERYYYSYLVDPRPRKRYGVSVQLTKSAFFFMPKPDIVVLLSHDPEAIYKRRQEHGVEEIGRQLTEYRELGMRTGKFLEIRTESSPEKVAMELANALVPKKYTLTIVASHPIQYQSPLWREIAQHQDVDVTVYYCVDWGVNKPQYHKDFFGAPYKWDIPLLNGYKFKFLRNYSLKPGPYLGGFINPGIFWEFLRHRYDAVLVMGWMDVTFWFAFLAAKITRTPVFLRAVASSYYDIYGNRPRSLLFVKKIILKVLFRFFVSGFLSIGTRNKNFYLEYGVLQEKIFNFPYAVWNEFFFDESARHVHRRNEIRKHLGIAPEAIVIIFAARFVSRRHPEHAIFAYEKLRDIPNTALLMVGDGEMMDELKEGVEKKDLRNVHFSGFKNQRELVEMYAISDIFVRADETIESGDWGATVNEAMACGLPVICTDAAAANVDLVQKGENGYVYDFGDIESLAKSIRALAENKNLLESMKKKSKEIISRWSYEEDVGGLLKALRFFGNRKK